MKNLVTAVVLITITASLFSCKKDVIGEGPITTQERALSNFTGIDLRMNGNVYYKNDSTWKVEVIAKQSIHAILETRIDNNHLVIRYTNGKTYDSDASIRINVSGPRLNSFELNTSGSIYCQNSISVPDLYLHANGSGDISLQNVVANTINAESTVSGTIQLTGGTATSATIKTDASGKVDLSAIALKNVTTRIVGSGDIRVKVSDHLDATILGSGSVYFNGYPVITTHISGSGRLIRF